MANSRLLASESLITPMEVPTKRMNDTHDIGGPSCPNCGSDDAQRIEGGAVGMYRCLACHEEFDADDDSDHAKSE